MSDDLQERLKRFKIRHRRKPKRTGPEASNGRPRAHFRNFTLVEGEAKGKPARVGRPIEAIGRDLAALTGEWPRLVYGRLFAEGPGYKPLWLDSADALFAWIGR